MPLGGGGGDHGGGAAAVGGPLAGRGSPLPLTLALAGPGDVLVPGLMAAIRSQYRLHWHGLHGAPHWARVLHNGLTLAAVTGARLEVVTLFAVFHDACRHNDDHDPHHGARGAALAASFRGVHFELDAAGLELLLTACRTHTTGREHSDVTVRTCWDADRLDLWRVGMRPDPTILVRFSRRWPTSMPSEDR